MLTHNNMFMVIRARRALNRNYSTLEWNTSNRSSHLTSVYIIYG